MKVLHISGAKGWGGNEQQMIYLFPELRLLGVENIVFGVKDSKLQQECNKIGIEFLEAKDTKLNKIINYRFLNEIVKNVKPDLIHLHTSDSLTVYTISNIIYKLNTKTVFSKKGMGSNSSFLSKLKYNYKGIDSIICVSKSVQRDLGKILNQEAKKKTVVVHDCVSIEIQSLNSSINLREAYNILFHSKIVGNIANHSNAKDLPTFINTVEVIIKDFKRNDIVFLQVGEFTKNTLHLKELVKEKGIENHIIFTDKIENASSIVNQFNVFLMTSQREGGPTSVLESMLIGVPVVSTNVGVVSEIIEDGKNGFIAPVKNYKLLAEKLLMILDNIDLQFSFSKKSKEMIVSNFTASIIANMTRKEYLKIIS